MNKVRQKPTINRSCICIVRNVRPVPIQDPAKSSFLIIVYGCWGLAISCARVGLAIVFGVLCFPSREGMGIASRGGPYYVRGEGSR